jgi:hypothetical protein|nr:MAG TPA: hypothetical protein [Caudoviricetes sp.]
MKDIKNITVNYDNNDNPELMKGDNKNESTPL